MKSLRTVRCQRAVHIRLTRNTESVENDSRFEITRIAGEIFLFVFKRR